MGHGDPDRVIAVRNGFLRQPVPFRTQDERQFPFRRQPCIVNGNGIIAKGHCCCLEAQCAQPADSRPRPGGPAVQDGPRDLEHSPHAYPYGTAVQRIAAGGCQQDGIHAQGGR